MKKINNNHCSGCQTAEFVVKEFKHANLGR
jgi:hypothetical protein